MRRPRPGSELRQRGGRGAAVLVGLLVVVALDGRARAQTPADLPEAGLIGGSSACPTPALVWNRLTSLVPPADLAARLKALGAPAPPVQVFDLGPSFRVTLANRVRDYRDEARDCADRAQFAAVFIALAVGADSTAPVPPAERTVPPVAPPSPPPPPPPRLHAAIGPALICGLGSGDPTCAPGLGVRVQAGRGRLVPVAGVTALWPVDTTLAGVSIRQWRGVADLDLRASAQPHGRAEGYLELGAALQLISDRPLNLAIARTQLSYAVGPRAAAGLVWRGSARWSAFLIVDAAWFPAPPPIFALPAGELGHAPAVDLGVIAGFRWGML